MEPSELNVRVMVVDDNEEQRNALRKQLVGGEIAVIGDSPFGVAAMTWAQQLNPDIVILSLEEPVARGLSTIELLALDRHSFPVLVVSSLGDRESVRKAMLAGARDYIVQPCSASDLHRSIASLHRVEGARRAALAGEKVSARHAMIMTTFGVKGGIGKTTLSTNVALSLIQETGRRVALVDLDVQFGDVAVMLDMMPDKCITDAVRAVDRLDPDLIESFMAVHSSGLRVLASPIRPEDSDELTGADVSRVLQVVASTYDYVVIDCSAVVYDVSMAALDLSTLIFLVTTPEVPCLKRTRAVLGLFERWNYSRDKVKVILNRFDSKTMVSEQDSLTALEYPVFWKVPNDHRALRSAALGVPVMIGAPNTKVARSLCDLARHASGLPPKSSGLSLDWILKRRPDEQPTLNQGAAQA